MKNIFMTFNFSRGNRYVNGDSKHAFPACDISSEIYLKLKEAELEASATSKRFSHKEVFDELRASVRSRMDSDEVI